MMAVIRLPTKREHLRPYLKQLSEMPHVIEMLRLTAEDCSNLSPVGT